MAGTGGKRQGAGRKPGTITATKRAAIDVAAAVLQKVNATAIWQKLVESKDERIRVDVMKYLTDRVHGKPSQALQIQGDKDKPLEVIIRVVGAS